MDIRTIKLVTGCGYCASAGRMPRDEDWELVPCDRCGGTGEEEVSLGDLAQLAAELRQIAYQVESLAKGFRLAEPDHAAGCACCDAGDLPTDHWSDDWD